MPLTRQQALDYFHSPDLIGLGFEADAVRRRLHPEGVVTYIIDRNINYTNFCTEYCTFCAFYRPLKRADVPNEGYILDFEKIYEKIAETEEMGGTGVLMQGGIHPDLKIDWFERLFTGIKQRFPKIWLHCLSASEVLAIAEYSNLSLRDDDRAPSRCGPRFHSRRRRRNSRRRCAPPHRAPEMPHRGLGQRSPHRAPARHAHHGHHDVRRGRDLRPAHQPFRSGSPPAGRDRRIHRLHPLELPAETTPRSAAAAGTKPPRVEYLKVLAIARLYLDNIENVQASWVTQGLKVLELGLHFGGNDVGSVMLEENVVKAAGTSATAPRKKNCAASSATPASSRCSAIRCIARCSSTD